MKKVFGVTTTTMKGASNNKKQKTQNDKWLLEEEKFAMETILKAKPNTLTQSHTRTLTLTPITHS